MHNVKSHKEGIHINEVLEDDDDKRESTLSEGIK